MTLFIRVAALIMAFGMVSAQAGEAETINTIRSALIKDVPFAATAQIRKTPIDGMYEVNGSGHILYVTADGRFVFNGDLIDLQKQVNITEATRSEARKAAVDELGEDNMVVYTPKGEVKHTVTVFTDIFCPYCQRLHQEMDQYMKQGVKVRYVFLPFKGPKSFATSVSVWCAKDQNEAMDMAKAGAEIEKQSCDNPISRHQALATELGIRGTPAILLENGYLNPGYVPVDKLVKQMETMGL